MWTICARNVNQALSEGLHRLSVGGVLENSRNGPVLVAPGPVCTIYERPLERVLFSPKRNANPFFHLMEALWMLYGDNRVAFPAYFNKGFSSYSDNGVTAHGAYGWRWIKHFGVDQLEAITEELRTNPESRRAVLTMWDPKADLGRNGVDLPCNQQAFFDVRGGVLNMTVTCRSNDVIWGCYGANAVHFSFLQEYLALAIGVPVGVYRQFSNNWHMYTELYPHIVTMDSMKYLALDAETHSNYNYDEKCVHTVPLRSTPLSLWREELGAFMEDPLGDHKYRDPFFENVVQPMYHAWYARKTEKDHGAALMAAGRIADRPWRIACLEWLERNHKARS